MATYKVIQDIEAEDKLLGPLTLKQFIFAVITVGFGGMAFVTVQKTGYIWVAIPFLPFMAIFGFLAAPIGRDQSTEVWLAARLRFLFIPRKRIWDQNGLKELVVITAPKKNEHVYTNNLSSKEVKSRLKALSDVIDSRGWAARNIAINAYDPQPEYMMQTSDRLVGQDSLPQIVPDLTMSADADIMDASNNPTAQHFEELVEESAISQKNEAITQMQQAILEQKATELAAEQARQAQIIAETQKPPVADINQQNSTNSELFNSKWNIGNARASANKEIVYSDELHEQNPIDQKNITNIKQPSIDQEQALLERIQRDKIISRQIAPHHKTILTPEEIEQARKEKIDVQTRIAENLAIPPQPSPDIIKLAQNNDFSVATIANQAKRKPSGEEDFHNNEVIELH